MMRLAELVARGLTRVVGYEGSTRSAALIRIFTAMILWDRHYAANLLFKSLDDPVHTAFSVVLFVGPALMIVGLFSRIATWATTVAVIGWNAYVVFVLGAERPLTWFVTYLLVGLCFTDCGRSFSIDRAIATRRSRLTGEPAPEERSYVWGLRLICVHVGVLYLFAALDKSDVPWLLGERMETYFIHFYGTSDWPSGRVFHLAMMVLAIGVVALEYGLAFGLWFRIGRRWLMVPGALMNLGFFALLPAGQIVWHTWVGFLAFFPPDEFHAFVDEQVGRGWSVPDGTPVVRGRVPGSK